MFPSFCHEFSPPYLLFFSRLSMFPSTYVVQNYALLSLHLLPMVHSYSCPLPFCDASNNTTTSYMLHVVVHHKRWQINHVGKIMQVCGFFVLLVFACNVFGVTRLGLLQVFWCIIRYDCPMHKNHFINWLQGLFSFMHATLFHFVSHYPSSHTKCMPMSKKLFSKWLQ